MPAGKPAGRRCLQLTRDRACALFGDPRRPAVCASLAPSAEMCGPTRRHAMHWLTQLEQSTRPAAARDAVLRHDAQTVEAPAGTVLFDEGAPCRGFPLVLDGEIHRNCSASSPSVAPP